MCEAHFTFLQKAAVSKGGAFGRPPQRAKYSTALLFLPSFFWSHPAGMGLGLSKAREKVADKFEEVNRLSVNYDFAAEILQDQTCLFSERGERDHLKRRRPDGKPTV